MAERTKAGFGRMSDDELLHLCRMATVWAGTIQAPDFDPADYGGEDPRSVVNCYRILADAFLELQARQGMKPTFRYRPRVLEVDLFEEPHHAR